MANVKRGEVYICTLAEDVGSVQSGTRPVLILQNDIGNKYSPTTIVAPFTSKMTKAALPTHMEIKNSSLLKDSVILFEQIRTIDKQTLGDKLFTLSVEEMRQVNKCIKISFALDQDF